MGTITMFAGIVGLIGLYRLNRFGFGEQPIIPESDVKP